MSRSKWKYKCIPKTLKQFKFKLWDRDLIIQTKLIGRTLVVYNGSQFFQIKVDRFKVGHKLGEFIYTRKYAKKESFGKKNKNKK